MRGKSYNFGEEELERLVLDEFAKVEREAIKEKDKGGKVGADTEHAAAKLSEDDSARPVEAAGLADDEEKFAAETAEWLRPRSNREAIVDRIWSLIVESDPGSFFSVHQEHERRDDEAPISSDDDVPGTEPPGRN